MDSPELAMDANYEDEFGAIDDDDHLTSSSDRSPIVLPGNKRRWKRPSSTAHSVAPTAPFCRRHRRLLLGIGIATAVFLAIGIGVVTFFLVSSFSNS